MFTAEDARNNRLSSEKILEEEMEYFYDIIRKNSRTFNSCRITQNEIDSLGLRSLIVDIVKKLKSLGYIVEREQDYIIIRWHKL